MKIGEVINVLVTDVQDHGVFVATQDQKVGFVDWHELSWFEHLCDPKMPQDVLEIGQMIDVKICGFRSDGNFAASVKRIDDDADPWHKISKEQIGTHLDCEIISVCEWGLIVRHPLNISVWCPFSNDEAQQDYAAGESIGVIIEMIDRSRGIKGRIQP